MKQLVRNYAINLANKEITLNDFTQVYQDRLRLITDVSTNQILYNFADASVASIVSLGTKAFYLNSLPATVATLDYLEIDYEVIPGDPVYDAGVNVSLQGTPGVNASIQGTPNVALAAGSSISAFQGGAWGVNASIVGTPQVNAALAANSTITAYQGTNPWLVNASIVGQPGVNASIQGTVPVSGTFWQSNQPVTASIAGNVPVTASIAGIVTVAGNFSVSTAPTITALQGNAPWQNNVSIQGTVPVSGTFWQTTQPVSGTVTVDQGTTPWTTQQAAGSTLTAYQGGAPWTANVSVQGTVAVSGSFSSAPTITALQGNAPWTSNVSVQGSVPVTGTFWQSTQPVSGTFWQATQPVSGTFWQAVQPVSGTVDAQGAQAAGVTLGMGLNPVIVAGEDYAANAKIQIPKYDSTGQGYVTASIAGTVPVSGFPTAVNVSLLGNATLTAYQGGTWTTGLAASSTITAYQGGAPWLVNASLPAGVTVSANQAGTWTVGLAASSTLTAYQGAAPWTANVSIQGTPSVSLQPGTAGWTSYATGGLAATIVSISHAAGEFGGYMLINLNSAPAYLQVFDVSSAAVTLGLTTPNIIIPLPANSTPANGLAANMELANGAQLLNGLRVAATTTATGSSLVATALAGTIWYH